MSWDALGRQVHGKLGLHSMCGGDPLGCPEMPGTWDAGTALYVQWGSLGMSWDAMVGSLGMPWDARDTRDTALYVWWGSFGMP